MEGNFKDKYSFIAEWYDRHGSIYRRFNFFYYPTDDTMEIYDIKNRKRFMRRLKVDGISLEDIHIGVTLCILGRLIKIVDYACEDTKRKLQKTRETIFVLMKPLPPSTAGNIINHFGKHGLRIAKMKQAQISHEDLLFLYRKRTRDPTYPFIIEYLKNSNVIGIELVGTDVYTVMSNIIGDIDPLKAAPGTIRALYGSDNVKNCIDAAADQEETIEDVEYFFPPPPLSTVRLPLTATLSNCTLCVVKPHAIREGKLGNILITIDEGGFNVTALYMLIVENINAVEFLEVYKGIVPEFKGMIDELSSGPCVAMEIVSRDHNKNSAAEFRKLVGPTDPDIARLLRPHTIRAKFGITKVKNAVHCSDLPEDGLLEVEYFFKILCL